MTILKNPPQTENELLARASCLEGLTFLQLAQFIEVSIPLEPSKRKGWTGQALERALATTAGTKALPDFDELGIELKSIPMTSNGKPAESTFVTTIPLLTIHRQIWKTSECYQKLKRILWVPVEGDKDIPFEYRRIGRAILWSPNEKEEAILCQDWTDLSTMIGTGKLEEIDASMGDYLQVRPKGANAKSLCYGFDSEGNKVPTLPRGFYLRSYFTAKIFEQKSEALQ